MEPYYKNLIWTKHALARMRERSIKQSDVWATWRNPDKSRYAKTKAAWVYHKTVNNEKIEIVAKKNEVGEWVIISVWSKPTYSRKTKKKETFLVKMFKRFLK